MRRRVLVAGASGVIGRRLCPLLIDAGYSVYGTTRREAAASELRTAGVSPVVLDVFDAAGLSEALVQIRPEMVIHQLTDLAGVLDRERMEAALKRNARLRIEGTRNLTQAASDAGVRRLIAQSIAWLYAQGREPHVENDPLDLNAEGLRGVSVRGVAALEESVLSAGPEGIVLRYGHLHGPDSGAGALGDPASAHVHVDAAAHAAFLALTKGERGVYNIAEPGAYLTSGKAERELGWSSAFRVRAHSR
jgi:nucleoside-diphosphate-sugar epimerase